MKVLAELTDRTGFDSALQTINQALVYQVTDPDSLKICTDGCIPMFRKCRRSLSRTEFQMWHRCPPTCQLTTGCLRREVP